MGEMTTPEKKSVFIVHCIDTEGPLYESVSATFQRLKDLFGLDIEKKTRACLDDLRQGRIDIPFREDVMNVLSGHLSDYNTTWDAIDEMHEKILTREFRDRLLDAEGNGWVFNWHCLDHVGYEYNPRRRDIGYHNIFDHYRELVNTYNVEDIDDIQWHYHPMSTYREAHRCATSYATSIELYEILSRRIIERSWFPSVFRAGFQAERPDSNLFLEQWIPFDMTNMSTDDPNALEGFIDFRKGRSGDWRRAPSDWSVYNPHHDDYQIEGGCRRKIARSLNVLNRIASIDQDEMDKAFRRANGGAPALVGLASHDFRNLGTEVDYIRDLVKKAKEKYPQVNFRFMRAKDAFKAYMEECGEVVDEEALRLEARLVKGDDDVPYLEVIETKGRCFGPQPYLAIKTRSKRFIHDNFDFDLKRGRWFYAFHADTLPLSDIESLGIASCDRLGNTCVINLNP